jgi:hypothetical protein
MANKEYHKEWYAKNRKKRVISARLYRKTHQYKEWNKRYKKKHKKKMTEYIKFWNIKRKYGLSKIDYSSLLKKQNYNCAVCETPLSTNTKKIHIDHCHLSGKVRGIVHQECNHLLGLSKDNVELLKKAIKYIQKYSK